MSRRITLSWRIDGSGCDWLLCQITAAEMRELQAKQGEMVSTHPVYWAWDPLEHEVHWWPNAMQGLPYVELADRA